MSNRSGTNRHFLTAFGRKDVIYSQAGISEYVAMTPSSTALNIVAANPPEVDVAAVAHEVLEQFALEGKLTPLISERDQNFRLRTADGNEYVVKVTSTVEQRIVSDFHLATLLHLEADGAVRAPRVIRTTAGQAAGCIEHKEDACILRVVSYLPGTQLAAVRIDEHLARDFGAQLAAMDLALRGFSHPGENPVLLWDLQRVTELRDWLHFIDSRTVLDVVARAIDDFEDNVASRIGSMRRQVIHGDANPENVLLDEPARTVCGFIDFGDCIKAPLVFDAAIAAAYLRTDHVDALRFIAPFIAAYHSVLPLRRGELAVLFDAVRARLATTITILCWRLGERADDDLYREKTLQTEGDAIRFLHALDDLGREGFLVRLLQEPGMR